MTIRKVALAGANGELGTAILNALLSVPSFSVTVLCRQSSKSSYPSSVAITRLSDDFPIPELRPALEGQDALVVVFAGSNSDLQIRLADAASQAGVKRFIPADFGSCDSSSERALELVSHWYRPKQIVREHLQQIAASGNSSLTWTSLVCGHFFDYGLRSGLLGFDLKARKALIFDGGDVKWSTTTLETIGEATARILQNEEKTKNRMLYIQSFSATQNEVLQSLEKSSGHGKWQVEHVKSEEYIKEARSKVIEDPKNAEEWEKLVSVVGLIDSYWEDKKDFANSLLVTKEEQMDDAVKQSLKN